MKNIINYREKCKLCIERCREKNSKANNKIQTKGMHVHWPPQEKGGGWKCETGTGLV
jgi:hypothetical protein